MKVSVKSKLGFLVVALLAGGMASAVAAPSAVFGKNKGWYCVSESPGNMQSSGHIGYGHGKSRADSARRAVDNCRMDGGFACAAPQCFPE